MQDLDISLRSQIDASFREARNQVNQSDLEAGVALAESAWGYLPQPKFEWDVSKSYVHALAGIYRDAGHFSEAVRLMDQLFASGTVKPYQDQPRFIMGTIYFEMGNLPEARRWLTEADTISKGRCFQQQPAKYKEVLQG